MLFDNKKFKFITMSAFYGAFVIAGIIPLLIGLANMNADTEYLNGLLSLFFGFILLALPYLNFLKSDFFEKSGLVFIFNLLSAIVVNLCVGFMLFMMGGSMISGGSQLQYNEFILASLFMVSFSIMMYDCKDDWFFLTDNVGYFVLVLIFPVFLGLAYLLCAFFNDCAILGIAVGFYLCCTMLSLNLSSFITSIVLLVGCMLFCGPSFEQMNVAENPLNILAFLPALLTVFYIIYFVLSAKIAPIKDDTRGRLIYTISVVVSSLALTVAQCFVVNTWWIVLAVLGGALVICFIINKIFGGYEKQSRSSSSYSGGSSSRSSSSSSRSSGGSSSSPNYANAAESVCRIFNYNSGSVGQFYYDVTISSYDRSSTYGGNNYEFRAVVDFKPMRSDLKDYEIKCSAEEARSFCNQLLNRIGNEANRRGLNAEVSVKPNFNL